MYKPAHITPILDIEKGLDEIYEYLRKDQDSSNPQTVVEHMNVLNSYTAWSGALLADAKHHHREVINSAIMGTLKQAYDERLSATVINKFVDSAARDYGLLVDRADRINKACTHNLDAQRSILSTLKQEMYNAQRG